MHIGLCTDFKIFIVKTRKVVIASCVRLLICQDFETMHVGKSECMSTSWPDIVTKLLPVIYRSKDKEAQRLQKALSNASTTGKK
jgi:hypothetical protein